MCSEGALTCYLGFGVGSCIGAYRAEDLQPCLVDTFNLIRFKTTPSINRGLAKVYLPGLPLPSESYLRFPHAHSYGKGGKRTIVKEIPRDIPQPTVSARVRLSTYLKETLERLEKTQPSQTTLTSTVEPSIVNSIKRLSVGAPAEARTSYKSVLEEEHVLPDFKATLAQIERALRKCFNITEIGTHPDDGADEKPSAPSSGGTERDPTPTAKELESFSNILQKLWEIDTPHRLQTGKDITLNKQARAASLESKMDRADKPLFEHVDEKMFLGNPVGKAFLALLDNYSRDSAIEEKVTSTEQREMDVFLSLLMRTPHMRYAHKVLIAWGVADENPNKFAAKVFDIWFTQYSLRKGGPLCSSGFEHVFCGEEKLDKESGRKQIIGLHNWVQFWQQEKQGKMDYRGYVGASGNDNESIISVRFAWNDADPNEEVKSVSTFLVGSSIEFEFAMATMCFLGFKGNAKVDSLYFGGHGPVTMTSFSWNTRYDNVIRSAYLEA